MREHKYRFWSPNLKAMSDPYTIDELARGHTMPYGYPDGIPLQYTGNNDCDDIEIYDGDIVEVIEHVPTSGQVQANGSTLWNLIDKGLIFEVGWNTMTPRIELYEIEERGGTDIETVMLWLWNNDGGSECLKIIGNKYQNAELLDDET